MENPSLNLLKYRPFPELAAALRARVDHILERLGAAVKEALPSADELTFQQLRDGLPGTFSMMADALASASPTPTRNFLSDSQDHGVCRYHQSFNLREVLVEYSLIRSIVVEEVGTALNRPLRLEEIVTLNVGIDAAARRAVTAFVSHQTTELESATAAQKKYLAFLSHDIRGNLNSILLTLEVLKREIAAEARFADSVADMDSMRRSILDTVATMDRFLNAQRFQSGRMEPKIVEVDLRKLLPEVVATYVPQAEAKNVTIRIDATRCPTAMTDRDLLVLVLQNLIANAVKYSNAGTVAVAAKPGAQRSSVISVSDEGPGIAPESLSHLFAPFTRGETHGQGGVGLGLSIARQAAEALNGTLRAESVVGKGSTFILEIPGGNCET